MQDHLFWNPGCFVTAPLRRGAPATRTAGALLPSGPWSAGRGGEYPGGPCAPGTPAPGNINTAVPAGARKGGLTGSLATPSGCATGGPHCVLELILYMAISLLLLEFEKAGGHLATKSGCAYGGLMGPLATLRGSGSGGPPCVLELALYMAVSLLPLELEKAGGPPGHQERVRPRGPHRPPSHPTRGSGGPPAFLNSLGSSRKRGATWPPRAGAPTGAPQTP